MPPSAREFDLPGAAPAVLLVHGFTGSPWEVRPVADALAARGYACRAPLLPGHGTSARELSRVRWRDWRDAVDGARARLEAEHGRVVLLGMSMGALLVLESAAQRPERVAGIVTLGCALSLNRVAALTLALARRAGRWMPDVIVAKSGGGSDVRDPEAKRANPGYRHNPLRAAREIAAGQASVRASLAQISAPLLALHGLLDQTAPLAASLALLRGVSSDDRTLVVLGGSGHLLGVDRDRDEAAAQVRRFVERVAGEPRRTRETPG